MSVVGSVSAPSSQALDRFKGLWTELTHEWPAVEVRTVCLDLGTTWFNLGTQIRPKTCVEELDLPDFSSKVDLENLRCISEQKQADEVPGILNEILLGQRVIGELQIRYGQMNTPTETPAPFSFQTYPRTREQSLAEFGFDFTSFLLWGEGGTPVVNLVEPALYQSIRAALLRLVKPVYGFGDLQVNFLGANNLKQLDSPGWDNDWWVPHVKAVLPIPLRFSSVTAREDGSLELELEILSSLNPKQIEIAAISDDPFDRSVERQKGRVNLGPISSVPRLNTARVTISSTPARKNVLVLSYGSLRADVGVAYGHSYFASNPRMAAYLAADRFRERLNTMLGSQAGSEFRQGVAVLFALLGYSVVDLEQINVEGTFDLLAISNSPEPFLVIEVTVAEADYRNKLTKLSRRAKDLALSIAPQKVLAVLVTGENELGATETETAAKESVGVVTRKDFATLATALGFPSGLQRISGILTSLNRSPRVW